MYYKFKKYCLRFKNLINNTIDIILKVCTNETKLFYPLVFSLLPKVLMEMINTSLEKKLLSMAHYLVPLMHDEKAQDCSQLKSQDFMFQIYNTSRFHYINSEL